LSFQDIAAINTYYCQSDTDSCACWRRLHGYPSGFRAYNFVVFLFLQAFHNSDMRSSDAMSTNREIVEFEISKVRNAVSGVSFHIYSWYRIIAYVQH